MASQVAASVTRLSDGRLIEVNPAWEALTGVSRDQALGRTTLELGHWSDEGDRAAFVRAVPGILPPTRLHLRGGEPHLVRMHTAVIPGVPDDLLLVQVVEAEREVQAEVAREETAQALRATNLELQQRVELHAVIERTARVGHWTNAENEQEVLWVEVHDVREAKGCRPEWGLGRSSSPA